MAVDCAVTCWLPLETRELAAPAPNADRTPRDTWRLARHCEADRRLQAAMRMLSALQRHRPTELGPAPPESVTSGFFCLCAPESNAGCTLISGGGFDLRDFRADLRLDF